MIYIITMQEILSEARNINGEQIILNILKRKGAPIKGLFYLEPDVKKYAWAMEVNPLTGNLKYEAKDILESM